MKKVCVYNEKGRVGKSMFAVEVALRLGFCYATNQNRPRQDIQAIIPEDEFLQVAPNDSFPKLSNEINVVFDLAGELVGYQKSIKSALKQSDTILVPVINEADVISATKHAITELEALKLKARVVLIATNLKKGDYEALLAEFSAINGRYEIFPVRHTTLFSKMIKEGRSAIEIAKESRLSRYTYRNVIAELDELFNFLTHA